MNYRALWTALGLVIAATGRGQTVYPPSIEWQRSFGGTNDDRLRTLQQTHDGGFILGGFSNSRMASGASGNKNATNFGHYDFWIVRLAVNGDYIWDKSFGGTNEDVLYSLERTSDGGFILGGYSSSGSNGNKGSANYGGYDFWVVRADNSGNRLWDRAYGGNGDDYLRALRQTADGGFILGGQSLSPLGGNKTSPLYGTNDFWVVRTGANGVPIWDHSYGGTGADRLQDLQQTRDGGFILGGVSLSNGGTGNKTSGNYGLNDIWLVKVDGNGNIEWQRTYGGTDNDELLTLQETTEGGFILGGFSWSRSNGNKTSRNYGNSDFWVIRTDSAGLMLWENTFGGSSDDSARSVRQTSDGGFIIGGASSSGTTGTKATANWGGPDFWVVRLDANHNQLWEQSFGGTDDDGIWSVQHTQDRGFILGGGSASVAGGNKTSLNFGSYDFWVVKLAADAPRLRPLPQSAASIRTNGFSFVLSGVTNNFYNVERSSNLLNWTAFQTNQLAADQVQLLDRNATNRPRQFYRARLLP